MLSLTRKTDYALLALARLADQAARGGQALSAREIADRDKLPLPLLMNLLKSLHRAGMVASARGAHGGYVLARKPEEITISDVMRVIEGPVRVALCCPPGDGSGHQDDSGCQLTDHCRIAHSIHRLNDRLREFLDHVSLRDLTAGHVPEQRRGYLNIGVVGA